MTTDQSEEARSSSVRELMMALGSSGASRVAALAVSVLINALMARKLTVGGFAYYGVTISLGITLIVLVEFGYQTSIVRFAGEAIFRRDPRSLAPDLMAGTLASIVCGIVVGAAIVVAGPLFLPDIDGVPPDRTILFLTALFVLTMALNTYYGEAIRGLGRVGLASSLTGMGQHGGVVRAAAMLALLAPFALLTRLNLVTVYLISNFASVVAIGFSLYVLHRDVGLFAGVSDTIGTFRRNFMLNVRMLFGQILQLFASQHAMVLIGGAMLSGLPLAWLVAAQQLRNLLTAPMTLFNGASPKLLIQAYRAGRMDELEHLMRIGASMAFLFVFVISLGLVAGGPWLSQLMFGHAYRGTYLYVDILVPGLIFNAFGGTAARALVLLGYEKPFLRYSAAMALFAVPTHWWAAKEYGGLGIVTMSTTMLIIQNLILIWMVRRYIGLWSYAYLDPRRYWSVIHRYSRRRLRRAASGGAG